MLAGTSQRIKLGFPTEVSQFALWPKERAGDASLTAPGHGSGEPDFTNDNS